MIESPYLAPIPRTTISEEIVKRLVSMIMDSGLKPGDKLPSERELMIRLEVGRSSLREAIKTLEALGIVEVLSGSGMFVAEGKMDALTQPLSWRLLMGEHTTSEIIEARRAVEIELAGLAAERATLEDIELLRSKLNALRNCSSGAEYLQADLEFHLAVARAGNNRVLYNVLETLRHAIRVWLSETFQHGGNRGFWENGRAVDDHAPVYEAIRNHDVVGARAAMEKNINQAAFLLRAVIDSENTSDGEGER